MKAIPLLSIIIPLYNTEKYIEDCLLSIVRSKVNPDLYEVIVVNDGSTDSSSLIVKHVCEDYSNIRLYNQNNSGVSVARMNGVSVARGDFIWFVDSDDWILPGALSKLITIIESVPCDVMTIHAPLGIYRGTQEDALSTPLYFSDRSIITGCDLLRSGHISVCPPEFVVRKMLFDYPYLFFPENTRHEDEYFCRVLQYFCGKVLQVNEPFYAYRQHDSSFMYTGGTQSAQGLVNVYRHLTSFAEKQVENKDKDWFQKDNLALLTATHFWFPDLIGTPAFKSFRKQNKTFIISEFKKYQHLLSRKDRMVGLTTLYMPILFKWRQMIQSRIRRSVKRAS